ncbi:MAG TPA: tetratricopeptide repeat protein [Kofleriaceae bacterium]|nr:tetratricopeptide repeat protein [Kofleriaceae bacterium]
MSRRLGALLLCVAIAACGGGSKKSGTTPKAGAGSGAGGKDATSMADNGDPGGAGGGGGGSATAPGMLQDGTGGDSGGGGSAANEPPVTFPILDPDPAQAKVQVDAQLTVARTALAKSPPDADGALRAAREALKIDASSVDAAAYVAFAYYHKKQLDTAELVLDDLFKRPTAKQNANVFYVYGLVYEHTNRPDQAVLAYRKAVEINPSFQSALVNLGAFQLRNKQYDEATQTFEKLTQSGRNDEVTWTSLGSAYRGKSGDYPPGSSDRNGLILKAEQAYKRATTTNASYGPAYFNLALLYLDADPFPSGGGTLDTLQRLNAAKNWLAQYKNMPGVDIKLFDERNKDIDKAITREQKRRAKAAKTKSG